MATEHDRAVLNSILDPSLPLGDVMNFEAPPEESAIIEPDGRPNAYDVLLMMVSY